MTLAFLVLAAVYRRHWQHIGKAQIAGGALVGSSSAVVRELTQLTYLGDGREAVTQITLTKGGWVWQSGTPDGQWPFDPCPSVMEVIGGRRVILDEIRWGLPQNMECPHCHSQISTNSKLCKRCGGAIPAAGRRIGPARS